jgi:Arm DNA-binding domain
MARFRIKISGTPVDPKAFNVATFERFAATWKLDKPLTMTDPAQVGLQVMIRNTGLISYHAHYHVNGRRPLLKLGHHPDMTIDQARELTKTVIALGGKGIDPTEGLHERLIRELLAKGTRWRP